MALDKPVVAVSTLQVIAAQSTENRILSAIDARMGEVYVGAFERHGDELVAVSTEIVCAPQAVTLPDDASGWHAVGTGFAAVEGALVAHLGNQLASVDASVLPHAGDVARLAVAAFARGEAVAPERIEPAYLRNNVALTLEEQRALRASR